MHLPMLGNIFRRICILDQSSVARILIFSALVLIPYTSSEKQISDLERDAISRFRPMVADLLYRDYMYTDKYLITWIRSTKMDLGRAKQKLSKAHEWRRENEVDNVLNEDFSKILKHCPTYTNVVDRQGRPVFVVSIGKCNARQLVLTGSRKRNQRYLIRILEGLTAPLYQNGTSVNASQCGLVADVGGFNLRQHACLSCVPFYIDFVVFYESYYPETAGYVISINTPRIIVTTFQSLLEPFVSESTVISLKPYGFDKKEWTDALIKIIPEDQLTREFGGTRLSYET